jgi:hypothetical protein
MAGNSYKGKKHGIKTLIPQEREFSNRLLKIKVVPVLNQLSTMT